MIKDLIRFILKIAIVAAIFVYLIAPRIPGMPNLDDFLHLPSWQDIAKLVVDPGDLIGKGQRLEAWLHSKMPDISIAGHQLPKPKLAPPNPFDKNKSNKENAEDLLDPGGLLH
jgi:hypothetical protein